MSSACEYVHMNVVPMEARGVGSSGSWSYRRCELPDMGLVD